MIKEEALRLGVRFGGHIQLCVLYHYLLGVDLVEVINNQLARLVLMESDLEGAMWLFSKVERVPLVSELRPITLLNKSYKLLSRIMLKRLARSLGTLSPRWRVLPDSLKVRGQFCLWIS